ncbi:MBL fold metallo-hydrolase [Terrimonas sp.]|uniref:MBL fold metallo-hydrolase n=1 Tax=Terrimonas sp. TaxID=1914338 RepID=UPI000D5171F8|nr:MBL fold metallo-hydrolase [Terrimonas sp.]PVD52588.1 MBL fold metallo-hydrolase [Terrimonas sp.]
MSYPDIKITFLGTGTSSGVPMIGCDCAVCTSADKKDKRLRSSILVQSATTTIAVDAGPDFRYQMLRTNTKKLDGIVFTHPHKDHVAGLDDVRGFNYFMQKPMQIYANDMTLEVIIREFPYAFTEKKYPGAPDININTIGNEPFQIGDISVIPVPVWHMHMPVLGFRFGKFTYITDANRIDEESRKLIRGSEVLVLNALRKEKHISHFSLDEAINITHEMNIPQAYLTHLSHQMGKHEDVSKMLPPGISLACDKLVLEIQG